MYRVFIFIVKHCNTTCLKAFTVLDGYVIVEIRVFLSPSERITSYVFLNFLVVRMHTEATEADEGSNQVTTLNIRIPAVTQR